MNNVLVAQLLVTTIVAIAGWYLVHLLTAHRDRSNKRRELRLNYLIDAYRKLEVSGNRLLDEAKAKDIENAIADIQLFGTKRQVNTALAASEEFASNKKVSFDALLNELRNDLRHELRLEPVEKPLVFLRIKLGS